MDINFNILAKNVLFRGIKEDEFEDMAKCLEIKVETYEKNEFILLEGETTNKVHIVLEGTVNIIKEDYWGNRTILTKIVPGQLFGETFAFIQNHKLEISAVSVNKTKIACIDAKNIVTHGETSCKYNRILEDNLVFVFANKNLMLTRKIEHLGKRNTREKLLSYLSANSKAAKSSTFTINLNRQELADFLSVDRSAMTTELTKLQNEGIITFDKNEFTIEEKTLMI